MVIVIKQDEEMKKEIVIKDIKMDIAKLDTVIIPIMLIIIIHIIIIIHVPILDEEMNWGIVRKIYAKNLLDVLIEVIVLMLPLIQILLFAQMKQVVHKLGIIQINGFIQTQLQHQLQRRHMTAQIQILLYL